jgi:hypothetical protein
MNSTDDKTGSVHQELYPNTSPELHIGDQRLALSDPSIAYLVEAIHAVTKQKPLVPSSAFQPSDDSGTDKWWLNTDEAGMQATASSVISPDGLDEQLAQLWGKNPAIEVDTVVTNEPIRNEAVAIAQSVPVTEEKKNISDSLKEARSKIDSLYAPPSRNDSVVTREM